MDGCGSSVTKRGCASNTASQHLRSRQHRRHVVCLLSAEPFAQEDMALAKEWQVGMIPADMMPLTIACDSDYKSQMLHATRSSK